MGNQLVNLKDENNVLIPKTILAIDTNNIIVSSKDVGTRTGSPWTATQDCYVSFIKANENRPVIDGVTVNSDWGHGFVLLVKEGQVITSDYAGTINVYGVKY